MDHRKKQTLEKDYLKKNIDGKLEDIRKKISGEINLEICGVWIWENSRPSLRITFWFNLQDFPKENIQEKFSQEHPIIEWRNPWKGSLSNLWMKKKIQEKWIKKSFHSGRIPKKNLCWKFRTSDLMRIPEKISGGINNKEICRKIVYELCGRIIETLTGKDSTGILGRI